MRIAFAVIGIVCFVGCDMARSTAGNGGDKSSQLSGAISIPDGFRGEPDEFCGGLDLTATTPGGSPVGRPSVVALGTECHYKFSELPVNTDLSVSVTRSGILSCMGGNLVNLQPAGISVNLKQGEARVADFQAKCGAT